MNRTLEFVPPNHQENTESLREALLDLERSKQIEEETRIESEHILACLTALSTVGLHKNALKTLLKKLQPVFEYDEACVLVPDPQDVEHCIVTASTHSDFQASRWSANWLQSRITMHTPLVAFNIKTLPVWQKQTDALRDHVNSALHIALRPDPKPAYLICTHPQIGFFNHKHSKRAIRFAPMAAQALINIESTEELSLMNQRLQREVEERRKAQKKLVQTQEQLVATARQAGMAEIATNVVHNIGNVLNSVNVGSEALQRYLNGMPLQYLRRMVEMVDEHQHIVANHDKLKLLPTVLEKLTHTLEQQHQNCCDELSTLHTHIDHITNIVKLQQESAGYQEVLEIVEPSTLMESALQISFSNLSEPNITIKREYQGPAYCLVDKHKVLQVLVNLIANAKQAMAMPEVGDRLLTLNIDIELNSIRFKVKDNGEGIEADKLKKIFNHGYTTRQDGSGFGLHSSALNAKQLGGELSVISPGKNQGSEFSLTIPLILPPEEQASPPPPHLSSI